MSPRTADKLILLVARGFGAGYMPVTPGTAGSVVGLGWVMLLLWTGSAWLFFTAVLLGILASVWICGKAAILLEQADPSSVVLDELVAVPVCFSGWIAFLLARGQGLPGPASLFEPSAWWVTVGLVLLFRVFDIAKPWPVYQSQSLPGGWGITIDDILAGVYVNICWGAWHLVGLLFPALPGGGNWFLPGK